MVQARVKTEAQAVLDHSPWKPPKFEAADAEAIQALHRGTATGMQQKRALEWICKHAAVLNDLSYRPGIEGDRDTAFAEGRRFVALQIVKLIETKIALR